MKKTIFLFLFLGIFGSVSTFGQTRVIRNSDLEKFRQKRLQAEKELRENYRKLGFPSPEELERQNKESFRNLTELSNRLRQQRIDREDREAERNNFQVTYRSESRSHGFINYRDYFSPNYYYGRYGYRGINRNRRHRKRRYKNRDFRQRFIDQLPSFVLRNHRFNQIEVNRGRRSVRSGFGGRRRNRH